VLVGDGERVGDGHGDRLPLLVGLGLRLGLGDRDTDGEGDLE